MTADQLADLKRQRAETWQRGGDGYTPHNVSPSSAAAARTLGHRRRRRIQRRAYADLMAKINAGIAVYA